NTGDILNFSSYNNNLSLRVGSNHYEAEYFQLIPVDSIQFLICNEMKLRGKLKIINNSNSVMMINSLDLESYLKGVIPKEMPLGKGKENYEALKAFAICARTYTLMKLNSKKYFDLYIDVRDQVYGGVDAEKPISNLAVDETKNLILTYDGKPAKVFYHSTCGGKTEDVKNIFDIDSAYYLSVTEDGNHPYCSISPSFNWEEVYTPDVFIERLKNANLVNKDFDVLENVFIVNRFESGRVNELRVDLSSSQNGETTSVILKGNNIRSIIRTANNKSILKSIWFDLIMDEYKNVTINGKGYGHGVGLCQWGAIGQSGAGKNFKEILSHYFPGTKISYLNDKN
ncbi:MAG: SpoIID/LytB domain-containing protein, partial [Ignavibacteria bacterium]|nr:SpoIID/LytB domain-containing protein [Ignavibacteria bacterium]